MAKKLPTIWELEPHTKAKHTILQHYLQAWMRIMTLGFNMNQRAIYIDGFAGPGEYSKGEKGSPIIALEESIEYTKQLPKASPQLRFIFIEEDKKRFNHLTQKIYEILNEDNKPSISEKWIEIQPSNYNHFYIILINDKFDIAMNKIFSEMEGEKLAPTFAFIDPFGFESMHYDIIKKIAENDRSEVFVNFMYEEINRWLRLPSLQDAYQRLFGTDKWKEIVANLDEYSPAQRRYFLHKLYKEQLHNAGFKYVISFEMKNKNNATKYFLYYGTNHPKGLEVMKDAMWKVDASGAYTFSDYEYYNGQLRFVEFDAPDMNILAEEIYNKFKGQSVYSKTVKDFVLIDTIFRRKKHSTAALRILEKDGRIKEVKGRKKSNSYPDDSIIIFR